jgi:diacylglycerol kinase (ATP)
MTGGAASPSSDPAPAAPTSICAVLRNPAAGRGRHAPVVDAAFDALRAGGYELRVLDASTIPEALAAGRRAVDEGATALIAMGGDGTVNLGLQAVAGRPAAFGVVPVGTGNDFAAEVGLPADPVAAARQVAEALRTRRTRAVDLARIDGPDGFTRRFAAVLGAGFDALVNERANAMRWPHGRRRYDLAIFAELVRLRPRHYRITLDGQVLEQDAVLVAFGNATSYGGGMRMCPAAELADGLLDVVIAGPISRTTLLRLQPRVYSGTHVTHPAVSTRRARTITIEAEGITAYADGERMCPLPITITVEPGALSLLV